MQDEKSKAMRKWVDALPFAVKKVSLDEFKTMYPKEDDMQDRINALAKQCGAVSDFLALGRHDGILFSTLELERFAQAIARECAEIVEEHAEALRAMNSKHEAAQAEMAADEIYARFGIAGE